MTKPNISSRKSCLHCCSSRHIIHGTERIKEVDGDEMKIVMMLTSLILLAAVKTDLGEERISNRLIAFGLAAGLGIPLCCPLTGAWRDCMLGMILPAALCWILFRVRALGAGDIKLFCVIGSLNGTVITVNSMVAAFILAACYAVYRLKKTGHMAAAFADLISYGRELQVNRRLLPYEKGVMPERRMHFSPAILLGYFMAFMGVDVWTFIS